MEVYAPSSACPQGVDMGNVYTFEVNVRKIFVVEM
jgi:hypothetical protein